jgi:hypothetical protein
VCRCKAIGNFEAPSPKLETISIDGLEAPYGSLADFYPETIGVLTDLKMKATEKTG